MGYCPFIFKGENGGRAIVQKQITSTQMPDGFPRGKRGKGGGQKFAWRIYNCLDNESHSCAFWANFNVVTAQSTSLLISMSLAHVFSSVLTISIRASLLSMSSCSPSDIVSASTTTESVLLKQADSTNEN